MKLVDLAILAACAGPVLSLAIAWLQQAKTSTPPEDKPQSWQEIFGNIPPHPH